MTVQELAAQYLTYFQTAKRDSGENYVFTTDDRPEELHELIREAHGDKMPDDWTYEFIEEALTRSQIQKIPKCQS